MESSKEKPIQKKKELNTRWRRLRLWQIAHLVEPGFRFRDRYNLDTAVWQVVEVKQRGVVVDLVNSGNPHRHLHEWLEQIYTNSPKAPNKEDATASTYQNAADAARKMRLQHG